VRTVLDVPTATTLPPEPVPRGTDGADVVTAPTTFEPAGAEDAGEEAPPATEDAAGAVGPGPAGAYPEPVADALEAALVEATYEAMAAALADEASATGQTVVATTTVSVTTTPADAEFLAGQFVTVAAQLVIVLVMK